MDSNKIYAINNDLERNPKAFCEENHEEKCERRCDENARRYITEYCQNTSIHGLKYIFDNTKRLLCERIWWCLSISASLFLCITLVLKTYHKWDNSPVIVSFATKETPIWQIPFPTVTICPETKSLPSKFNYTKYLLMKKKRIPLSPEDEIKFGLLSMLCNYNKRICATRKYNGTSEGIFEFFEEVQPPFYEMISECKFMGKHYNCSELFTPIFIDEGLCYSFNLLGRSEMFRENVVHFKNYHEAPRSNWTLEYGYPPEEEKMTYPRRSLFAGVSFALEAKLSVYDDDLDYMCSSSLQGFKIQISHPSGIPRTKQQHFRIPLDQAVMASIVLDMMSTSEAVKNYQPSRRNCYFAHERPLKYYKIYTQQNCQIECKTNYTLDKCDCVNFYMPRYNTSRVCSGTDIHCIYKAEMNMLYAGIDDKIDKARGIINKTTCDCLPICTQMKYIVENSQSDWKWQNQYKVGNRSAIG